MSYRRFLSQSIRKKNALICFIAIVIFIGVSSSVNSPKARFASVKHDDATRDLRQQQQRIEFVHIPKTGGSSIEKAAGKAGIPWGACHFHHQLSKETNCPSPPDFADLGLKPQHPHDARVNLWHVPPRHWSVNMFQDDHTFTIVRNPYDLAVSIYHDKWIGYWSHARNTEEESPATLNNFLQEFYTNPPLSLFKIQQSDYVYDDQGRKVIDHVIKLENIDEEFAALMDMYNLSDTIKLPAGNEGKFNKAPMHGSNKKLGVQDLSDDTLRVIERHYNRDFDFFNYTRIDHS